MRTIHTEVPEQLYKKAEALVKEGWFRDEKKVFCEAIRRFIEINQCGYALDSSSYYILCPVTSSTGSMSRLSVPRKTDKADLLAWQRG